MKSRLITQSIADYLAKGGVIVRLPPAFTAPSQHAPALSRTEAELLMLRAGSMKKSNGNYWLFNKPPNSVPL
jgi:hypothetical protein